MPHAAVPGIFTRIDETFTKGLGELPDLPEILVIPGLFAGEQRVQGMVEVVVPDGIETVAAQFRRADQPTIVEVAFSHEAYGPAEPFGFAMDRIGQFRDEGVRRTVHDGMKRVQPQRVDVAFTDPVESAFDKVAPCFIAVRSVEVEGCAPGGSVASVK